MPSLLTSRTVSSTWLKRGSPSRTPLPGGAHAEARGAVLSRTLRATSSTSAVGRRRPAFIAGIVAGALGAIAAILRAATGLDGEEGAELDLVPAPMLQNRRRGPGAMRSKRGVS